MHYRHVLYATGLLCAGAVAQQAPPPADGIWTLPPAPATTAEGAYRSALSTAAKDAQRFNFSNQPPKDNAPPDQTAVRVIINHGHGPHVNCIPMGVSGACH